MAAIEPSKSAEGGGIGICTVQMGHMHGADGAYARCRWGICTVQMGHMHGA